MQHLTPEQKQLGEYLIGSLDDDGLLRKSTETILDELAIYQGVYTSAEELEHVLSVIQDFDPAGIGARSLQECLLIQIRRKKILRSSRLSWTSSESAVRTSPAKIKTRLFRN